MQQTRVPTPNELEMIRLEYRSSLADLTFNSKPIITNLTIIANENIAAASAIVQAIEDQIRNAQPRQKLPVFYLLDSICKNVGNVYISKFSQNLMRTFSIAYDAVNDDDRSRMSKVLSTWWNNNGVPLFPPYVLQQIDDFIKRRIGQFGQIYVNPSFMPRQQNYQGNLYDRPTTFQPFQSSYGFTGSSVPLNFTPAISAINTASILSPLAAFTSLNPPAVNAVSTAAIQQDILAVLTVKQQMAMMQPTVSLTNDIALLGQILNLVQTSVLDESMISAIRDKLRDIAPNVIQGTSRMTAQLPAQSVQQQSASLSTPFSIASGVMTSAISPNIAPSSLAVNSQHTVATSSFGAIDLANLSTLSLGFLDNLDPAILAAAANAASSVETLSTSSNGPSLSIKRLQRIRLSNEEINRKQEGGVSLLYDTLELQCKQCGIRFARTSTGKKKFDDHLDWHFRQNEKKSNVSRDWYLNEQQWIEELEVEFAVKERQGFFFGNQSTAELDTPKSQYEIIKNLSEDIAAGAKNPTTCAICNEKFSRFFEDENEVWMLENAILMNQNVCTYLLK
ncbi:hypothetical protein HK096_005752 [Nowakowskiella sp. JEL0078]|nr:hypothetical protein HK096_005752 [Nowakowskiella sp. JEL0078]